MIYIPILIALVGWFFLYLLSINNAFRSETKDTLKEYIKSNIDLSDKALTVISDIEKNINDIGTLNFLLKDWNSKVINHKSYILNLRGELIKKFNVPLNDQSEFWIFLDNAELPVVVDKDKDKDKDKLILELNMYRRNISLNLNKIIRKANVAFYKKFPRSITSPGSKVFKIIIFLFLICLIIA